ncbi:MAG: PD-(D/E)XK nuclease family protein, partial [Bacteroidota bacterium]
FLEYLFKFHTLFNKLNDLNKHYGYLKSLESLYVVYKELLNSETLDFKGEPLRGLQIMGMLESRALDFETVIITSVNEGILPGGKTPNSVIPFEIKLEYNLPTYKEKDAVYTYHFYRLLQRAKNVHLIYNTEIDTLKGGEKSRFINQLEVEAIHNIKHQVLSADVTFETPELKTISKNQAIVSKLMEVGQSGFSPSALTKYVRNPLEYYYQYVLGVKETETVEEYIAANTLGTILHESLETLYKPFIGKALTIEALTKSKGSISKIVDQGFIEHYGKGNYDSGKNLIAFEVAKRYLHNFIASEQQSLRQGHIIKIVALEYEDKVTIPIKGLDQTIQLKGTVDRIDLFNGQLRIIDYKTGRVNAVDVAIYDWEELITDYGKSKAFQLLCYAYIYWKSTGVSLPIEAGIISFKNLKSGVLKFGEKPSVRGKLDPLITEDTLLQFEELASQLILEILDVNQPFKEKET